MLRTRPTAADFVFSDDADLRHSGEPFAPALEEEYARSNLTRYRTLVRAACTCAALLAVLRCVEQILIDAGSNINVPGLALIVTTSLLLAAIAWSREFERLYLPLAQVIVPLRNGVVGMVVAEAVAKGELELLIVLPLALIGPFFFLAVSFRTALLSGVLTTASFAAGAALFGLEHSVAWRAGTFLLISLGACAIAARHLHKSSRISFLEARIIVQHAQHDSLTGLKNRRIFDDCMQRLWQQAAEAGRSMAILLIDVDHFKAYNDRYGHQAGDQTLRSVAEELRVLIDRPADLLARYGGEEFAAVLYDVDQDLAMQTAERMRLSIAQLNIPHQGPGSADRVTVSIGVGVVRPTSGRAAKGMLQLADQALYEAKRQGRNRVELLNECDHRMLVTGMFARTSTRA